MSYSTLLLKFDGAVATLTLNRPDKRNALSATLIAELLRALDEIEASRAQIAILTGAGKAFCAGMDLEMLQGLAARTHAENLEDSRQMARMFRRIYEFPKPLLAAVNGAAVAGGCGIATLCDFTLAAPEAKFGYTEVKIGFIPAIVSVFLLRMTGEKRARDLLLTGRLFDAPEAHALGLVTEIVPAGKLMVRAQEFAKSLLGVSPTSLLRTKKLLRDFYAAGLDHQLALAVEANAAIRATADFKEGLASFLEKRPPRWSGQ